MRFRNSPSDGFRHVSSCFVPSVAFLMAKASSGRCRTWKALETFATEETEKVMLRPHPSFWPLLKMKQENVHFKLIQAENNASQDRFKLRILPFEILSSRKEPSFYFRKEITPFPSAEEKPSFSLQTGSYLFFKQRINIFGKKTIFSDKQ